MVQIEPVQLQEKSINATIEQKLPRRDPKGNQVAMPIRDPTFHVTTNFLLVAMRFSTQKIASNSFHIPWWVTRGALA